MPLEHHVVGQDLEDRKSLDHLSRRHGAAVEDGDGVFRRVGDAVELHDTATGDGDLVDVGLAVFQPSGACGGRRRRRADGRCNGRHRGGGGSRNWRRGQTRLVRRRGRRRRSTRGRRLCYRGHRLYRRRFGFRLLHRCRRYRSWRRSWRNRLALLLDDRRRGSWLGRGRRPRSRGRRRRLGDLYSFLS